MSRAYEISDRKISIHALPREEGRLSCVCTVGKSARGRSRRQIFRPLSMLELTLERKAVGRLATVKDAPIAPPVTTIPFAPDKLTISQCRAE